MSQIIADTLKLIADNQDVILSAVRLAATNKEVTMATLKISDLSVGDWVSFDTAHLTVDGDDIATAFVKKIQQPTRIKSILGDQDLIFAEVENDDVFGTIYLKMEHICPIPITAEILEKNGWSNDGMYAFLRIDEHRHLEYYYHEHRLRKYYCGVDEWQNHAKVNNITFAVHCYSVHQFQHALRLALGNAFDNLVTAVSFFGNLLDYMRLHTPSRRMRPPQRRTIGKEHRGYARRSRQRLVQRKG